MSLVLLVQSSAILTQSNLSRYCNTTITVAESELNIRITTDTTYLTLTDELWGVYCEDFGENWAHYNGTTLYVSLVSICDHDALCHVVSHATCQTASCHAGGGSCTPPTLKVVKQLTKHTNTKTVTQCTYIIKVYLSLSYMHFIHSCYLFSISCLWYMIATIKSWDCIMCISDMNQHEFPFIKCCIKLNNVVTVFCSHSRK